MTLCMYGLLLVVTPLLLSFNKIPISSHASPRPYPINQPQCAPCQGKGSAKECKDDHRMKGRKIVFALSSLSIMYKFFLLYTHSAASLPKFPHCLPAI